MFHNFLKQSLVLLKKYFLYLFSLEICFLVTSLLYFIQLKRIMFNYLTKLESFTPDIQTIQNTTDQATQSVQVEQLINALGPSTQSMVFLLFILTPLIIVGLWTLFQGLIWRKLQQKQIPLFQYVRQCIIASVGAALLSIIIVNIQFIPVMVLLLILEYYFLTLVYAWPHQISLIHISKMLAYGLSHLHTLGPYVLLLTLTSTALFVMIGMAFMRYTLGVSIFSWPWYVGYGIIVIALNIYLKVLISLKIHQN
ncbi:MAG: hypothetical protein AABX72_05070, partial [Nanoarchaeota archaeon]